MARYQPLVIGDFAPGIEEAKEPWLSPQDAFRTLENGYIKDGRLKKRGGYIYFGELGIPYEQEVHYTTPGSSPPATVIGGTTSGATVMNSPVVAPVEGASPSGTLAYSIYIECAPFALRMTEPIDTPASGTVTLESWAGRGGGATVDANVTGSVDLATGIWLVQNLSATPFTTSTAWEFWYEENKQNATMGLFENRLRDGSNELWAFDTRRCWRYQTDRFQDKTDETAGAVFADVWAGSDANFFSFATADDDGMYIVNQVDVPYKWLDTASPKLQAATQTGIVGTSSEVKAAYHVLWWKSRLWYIRTLEGGSSDEKPQRARFSKVNQPESFNTTDWIEATTSERITGATILGEDLIVTFEDSVWTIEETGDFRIPFRFRRLPSNLGALGSQGITVGDNVAVFPSRLGFGATDGVRAELVDREIPAFGQNFSHAGDEYLFSARNLGLRHTWTSYVDSSDATDRPNNVLAYDYETGGFAIFNIGMSVFGSWRRESSLLWGDLAETWDDTDFAWDDILQGEGFPIFLGGDRDSKVWEFERGGADGVSETTTGSAITLRAFTQRLNPFAGQRFRVGYMDVYADAVADASALVSFYKGTDLTPFYAKTVTFDPTGTAEKVRKRVVVNASVEYLSFQIEMTDRVDFDAFVLWVAPVARARAL